MQTICKLRWHQVIGVFSYLCRQILKNRIMNKKIIITTLIAFMALAGQGKSNVELTVRVSPFINEIEQMLYVYQLNGNNYSIDDSVRIEPGRDVYVVHANVPYETTVRLLFSKRGPLHMQILACPNDVLEIEITEEDQKVEHKMPDSRHAVVQLLSCVQLFVTP